MMYGAKVRWHDKPTLVLKIQQSSYNSFHGKPTDKRTFPSLCNQKASNESEDTASHIKSQKTKAHYSRASWWAMVVVNNHTPSYLHAKTTGLGRLLYGHKVPLNEHLLAFSNLWWSEEVNLHGYTPLWGVKRCFNHRLSKCSPRCSWGIIHRWEKKKKLHTWLLEHELCKLCSQHPWGSMPLHL